MTARLTNIRSVHFIMAATLLVAGWAMKPSLPEAVEDAHDRNGAPGHIYYVDVEGWYRRTPDEVAVVSRFDLSLDNFRGSLPMSLDGWQGGDRPADPEISRWLGDPPLAVERTYVRGDGAVVWLSAFGHRGDPSFYLFEHTPETCYPLSGWTVTTLEPAYVPLGPRPLPVNMGTAENGKDELVFLFLYLWDSPARDPERGIVSLRLGAPIVGDMSSADARSVLVDDFLPALFETTTRWSSF